MVCLKLPGGESDHGQNDRRVRGNHFFTDFGGAS